MSTFYSILYAQLNAATHERLTIGMVMVSEETGLAIADYSRRKLKIVTELNGAAASRNLKWALTGFLKAQQQLTAERDDLALFKEKRFHRSVFTERYLKYLSSYQNNLLIVDPPRKISLPATEETFNKLYMRNVDATGRWKAERVRQERRFAEIKSREDIRDHFRIDVTIDRDVAPSIRIPVRVDLAGRNELLTVAKFVDTDRPTRFTNQDAHAFNSLLIDTPEAKHWLVSSEPNKVTSPEHHYAWKNLYEAFRGYYLDLKDVEEIEQYAEAHHVEPLTAPSEE